MPTRLRKIVFSVPAARASLGEPRKATGANGKADMLQPALEVAK